MILTQIPLHKMSFSLQGNKGAVSIRLDVYERSLCLINAHLAAHIENWADRDKEYHTIITSQTYSHPKTPTVLDHE